MDNSFIYQNADRIEDLIEELRVSPRRYVRVPLGRRPVPLLNRILLSMFLFCLVFFILFVPVCILAMAIFIFVPVAIVVAYSILFSTFCALVVAAVGFFKYSSREEYKRCLIEDLTYYDLARMVAREDGIFYENEEIKTIEPDEVENDSVEGVIYWMERVKGEGEILPGTDSYQSLENSVKYLNGILKHPSTKISSSILEGMSKTLEYYDRLVNEEIPTKKVVRMLRKIESVFDEYERVCEDLYEQSIDNDLLETEIHLKALNSQLELNGFGESDFNVGEDLDFEIPVLVKKRK